MYRIYLASVFVTLIFLAVVSSAQSEILRVEQDGSGDYLVIQDAVIASASGDTILIGPGRYNDGQLAPGWNQFTRVLVTQAELTLIGAGPGNTILGPVDEWNSGDDIERGILACDAWGNRSLHVEGIRFVNMTEPIFIDDTESFVVKNCSFSGNAWAIILDRVDSVIIRETVVVGSDNNSALNCWGIGDFKMFSSRLDLQGGSDGVNLLLQGTDVALISDCVFLGGEYGIRVSGSTVFTLNNCSFQGHLSQGILANSSGAINIQNTTFSDSPVGYVDHSYGGGTLMLNHCVFENMTSASLSLRAPIVGYIKDCDLSKGERYTVLSNTHPNKDGKEIANFDMTNNWWGTTEPDSIQAWICDYHDFSDIGYIIDWEPYLTNSVPTKRETMGGVKALFR